MNDKIFRKVSSVLKEVYSKYKERGVLSVYLWGSILTEDFRPGKSDIDSVAIVDNNFDEKLNDEINKMLSEEMSGLKYFKINCLFLDELHGKEIRGRLASVIHPNLLLLDFKHWKNVAGKKFSREDFSLKEWSNREAIVYHLRRFENFYVPLIEKGDYSKIQYLCKSLLRVCHLVNEINKGESVFAYKTLLRNSSKEDKELVKLLLKLREKDFDEGLFKANFAKLRELVGKIR